MGECFVFGEWGELGGVDVFAEVWRVFVTEAVDVARGGGTDGEVIFVEPVEEVVAAAVGWFGEAGYFVMFVAGVGEGLDGGLKHLCFEVVIDLRDAAHVAFFGERGVGFVDERVAGEVGGVEIEGLVEVVAPLVEGLAWDGVDEIEIEVVDAGLLGEFDGAGDIFGIVPAFECFKVVGVEGLGADGEAVDAALCEGFEEARCDGFGIGFDGEFVKLGKICGFVKRLQDLFPELRLKIRGGAAAREDCLDGCGQER